MHDGCDAYAYESATFVSLGPPSWSTPSLLLLAREMEGLIRLGPPICQPINRYPTGVFAP